MSEFSEQIKNYHCETCNTPATSAVNELKEGVPDRGWQTWEWVATHFYCDVHRPEPWPPVVPDQIFYGYPIPYSERVYP